MNRVVFLNNQLYKWKIKNRPKCDRCKTEDKKLIHFFVECPSIQEFWHNIQTLISSSNINWSADAIMANCVVENSFHITNLIVLVAKYFLFREKCQERVIKVQNFKIYLRELHDVEKVIAVKNGKLNQHETKWTGTIDKLI